MAGNVSEWVEDDYKQYVYIEHGEAALCPTPPTTISNGLVRGGSYLTDDDRDLRAANREEISADQRLPDIGFRCVIDLPTSD